MRCLKALAASFISMAYFLYFVLLKKYKKLDVVISELQCSAHKKRRPNGAHVQIIHVRHKWYTCNFKLRKHMCARRLFLDSIILQSIRARLPFLYPMFLLYSCWSDQTICECRSVGNKQVMPHRDLHGHTKEPYLRGITLHGQSITQTKTSNNGNRIY